MKPLFTSVTALREMATGLSTDALKNSDRVFLYDEPDWAALISSEDRLDTQRVVVARLGNRHEMIVPDHLANSRREVLSRMASFAERVVAAGPVSLPRGWHQYKHNNLVAFFAVPGTDALRSRWIAEVHSGQRSDVVFWRATTSEDKETLEGFDASDAHVSIDSEQQWARAIAAAAVHFQSLAQPESLDSDILLSPLAHGATRGWSYHQWMDSISDEQRSFVLAATDHSVRLKGPAGSGKTLTLTLKAIREVLEARDSGSALRVLVATHSWSLATEIQESIDTLGFGVIPEIDVFPLLEIAQAISPQYVSDSSGYTLVGTDSFSGKQAQLDEIFDVIDAFVAGDWITYRSGTSEGLRARFDSTHIDDRLALAWDLLLEFGSVIGAAAIFPGAGSESKYLQLPRANWMLPLSSKADKRLVFELYCRYMESLDSRSLLTADQVLADLLNHLETHAWNRARRTEGYDLIFVDEFHLFTPLERQVLHYLSRDVTVYPKFYMALDPRQSPSEAFIGLAADETQSLSGGAESDDLGNVTNYELSIVHRYTPEILELIKHVNHEFPTLDLGEAWNFDFASVESGQSSGDLPVLVESASRGGEETDVAKAVMETYSRGRVAIAVVDEKHWTRYSDFAALLSQSGKFQVSTITGRDDAGTLGYRRRGVVIAPAAYLAGLQFESVFVVGVPDMGTNVANSNERTRLLSLLYLSISRAESVAKVFVNEDDGGAPEVLTRAASKQLLIRQRGSLV